MLAHRLRHRVAIERQLHDQDPDTGRLKTTWEVLTVDGRSMDSVPAEVLTGPGREYVGSGTVQGEIAARINMRWFPGLEQSMRILWDGHVFNVASIETDATARQEYRLRCTAGVDEGI